MSTNESIGESQTNQTARRLRFSEIGSFAALAFSLLALVTAIYQTRLMQSQTELMQVQSRASVWPYISIGFSYFDGGDNPGFTWHVDNNGVGPALIKSVTLTLDGRPIRNWDEVFPILFGHGEARASEVSINGTVLPPSTNRETTVAAIHIGDLTQARRFYEAHDRFKMSICYCSVYNECWVAKSLEKDKQPVGRCETKDVVQFEM